MGLAVGGLVRGMVPASKVAMMIMRPPQHGHRGRWSSGAAAALVVSAGTDSGAGAASSSLTRAMFGHATLLPNVWLVC